ncbi:hypothetical protein BJV78DRAFT_233183 [Lactifluus subvellereus]|nr:hypothetical protein BJV78DRAFT_233183 [Lactifluus subvellereus]
MRAGPITAWERVATALRADGLVGVASSVFIKFSLWDLPKSLEVGEDKTEGIKTQSMLPAHWTRSIWCRKKGLGRNTTKNDTVTYSKCVYGAYIEERAGLVSGRYLLVTINGSRVVRRWTSSTFR